MSSGMSAKTVFAPATVVEAWLGSGFFVHGIGWYQDQPGKGPTFRTPTSCLSLVTNVASSKRAGIVPRENFRPRVRFSRLSIEVLSPSVFLRRIVDGMCTQKVGASCY